MPDAPCIEDNCLKAIELICRHDDKCQEIAIAECQICHCECGSSQLEEVALVDDGAKAATNVNDGSSRRSI